MQKDLEILIKILNERNKDFRKTLDKEIIEENLKNVKLSKSIKLD